MALSGNWVNQDRKNRVKTASRLILNELDHSSSLLRQGDKAGVMSELTWVVEEIRSMLENDQVLEEIATDPIQPVAA